MLLFAGNLLSYDVDDAEPILPLPEGDYKVRCTEVEVRPSKRSARSNLVLSLVVLAGAAKGRTITRFVTMPMEEDKQEKYEDGRTAYGAMLDRLVKTVEGFGVAWKKGKKLDVSLLKGQEAMARIRHKAVKDVDGNETGDTRAEVTSIFQPSTK